MLININYVEKLMIKLHLSPNKTHHNHNNTASAHITVIIFSSVI